MMVLSGEEVLECEVHDNEIQLENVAEFTYLGCILNELDTDEAECQRKVASGRRVAGAIRSIVNARDLHLDCARVLHETLLVSVLMYDSETMLLNEKEKSRIKPVQMDNLRRLLGIRKMDRCPEYTDKGVVWSEKGSK